MCIIGRINRTKLKSITNRKYQKYTDFNFAPQFFIFFQVLAFAVAMVIFSIILVKGYHTDLDAHIAILERHLQVGAFPMPPLYYFALYLMQPVSYTHLRAHETDSYLVCRL